MVDITILVIRLIIAVVAVVVTAAVAAVVTPYDLFNRSIVSITSRV